jgi:hypothetical protein
MKSQAECTCSADVIRRYEEACARIRDEVGFRADMVRLITNKAQHFRLDVTVETVNRHYTWFRRWYDGEIAKGYLIERTGIKQIPRAQ